MQKLSIEKLDIHNSYRILFGDFIRKIIKSVFFSTVTENKFMSFSNGVYFNLRCFSLHNLGGRKDRIVICGKRKIADGDRLSLTCDIAPYQLTSSSRIAWYHNDSNIVGEENTTYQADKATVSDTGFYRCAILNDGAEIAQSQRVHVIFKCKYFIPSVQCSYR